MANYIACRSCIEPDCTGCNMFVLEKALKQGRFDGLKDAGHTIRVSTDVAPVRHGRWHRFSKGSGSYNGVIMLSDAFQCTVCKESFWNKSNYCPNCGCTMDGG